MYKVQRRKNAVIIGRFQPVHLGHLDLIKDTLKRYQKTCIVFGSAQDVPSIKNPFPTTDRMNMVDVALTPEEQKKIIYLSVRDYPYNDNTWLASVRSKVLDALECDDFDVDLIGHFKDSSSFYLKMFPTWNFWEAEIKRNGLSATEIRHLFLTKNDKYKEFVHKRTAEYIEAYRDKIFNYQNLCDEYQYILKYKEDTKFRGVPFPPTFVTADAVVVQSGHVLIIERGHNPGKGLLALPGGFLAPEESLEHAAIRELKEETKIPIDKIVLRSCIKANKIFDDPNRSMRGRTITNAFYFELPDDFKNGLPKVEAADDAAKAFWMPLEDISKNEDKFFEDHAHIIRYFTKTM